MAIRTLPAKRLIPSWSIGLRGRHLAPPLRLARPGQSNAALIGTFLLCLGTLAGMNAWRGHGTSGRAMAPAISSIDMGLPAAALPASLVPAGTPRTHLDAATIDGGIPAVVAAEQRDGFQEGTIQDLRSGARALRALTWLYGTRTGAEDAYIRNARSLSSALPDPSLQSQIEPVVGMSSPALLATYDSVGAGQRYTVSTIVVQEGRLVVQVQAFPGGRANGYPARDRADLVVVARLLVARAPAR